MSHFSSTTINGQTIHVSLSSSVRDAAWDDFLLSTPAGEYQQSSMWAEFKAAEGWRPLRLLLRDSSGAIHGGAQILCRRKLGLKIGYVMRGPAFHPEPPEPLRDFAIASLKKAASKSGLSILLLQPPAALPAAPDQFSGPGFLPYPRRDIITSTMVIDLTGGIAAVESRMRRRKLQEVRQAARRGARLRLGTEKDIPAFFDLMAETCQRQRTPPNPSSPRLLRSFWDAFQPRGALRLVFADVEDRPVAAWLTILFGPKATFYKTGWTAQHRRTHAVQLLIHDAIRFAAENGFQNCDFAGFSLGLALTMAHGNQFSAAQQKSRDFYKLGFGGTPLFLAEPRIWIANPCLRFILSAARRFRQKSMNDRFSSAVPGHALPPHGIFIPGACSGGENQP